MSSLIRFLALPIVFSAWTAQSANAAFTYPGCNDIAETDFHVTQLVTRTATQIEEPMKMAFDLVAGPGEDAKDKVDIYFTERKGNLRRFDSKQNKVITLASWDMTSVVSGTPGAKSSDGLL